MHLIIVLKALYTIVSFNLNGQLYEHRNSLPERKQTKRGYRYVFPMCTHQHFVIAQSFHRAIQDVW